MQDRTQGRVVPGANDQIRATRLRRGGRVESGQCIYHAIHRPRLTADGTRELARKANHYVFSHDLPPVSTGHAADRNLRFSGRLRGHLSTGPGLDDAHLLLVAP